MPDDNKNNIKISGENGGETAIDKNLLIFGLGYAASATALRLKPHFNTIAATNRSITASDDDGYQHLVFDGVSMSEELIAAISRATHILVSIGPGSEGDPVVNAGAEFVKSAKNLQWIGYLSTVGVYGDHEGEWVDEDTPCRPVSQRSHARLEAEGNWLELAGAKNIALAIFRLSGIYGPGRNALVNMTKGRSRRLVKENQVFNRIHRDDIATAVKCAIELGSDGIFNITDDEPAPPQDVVTYVHQLHGSEPPPEIAFETAQLTPIARSFYGENKRVSNAKSKAQLGMSYAWPNYRVAFDAMWNNDNWQR